MAWATACDDSSAGRMPSQCASMSKARGLPGRGSWCIPRARRLSSSCAPGRRRDSPVRPRRVHVAGLAVVVLHHVAEAAVQNAGTAEAQRRSVLARTGATAAGLDAHQAHVGFRHERIEHAGRVAAAADTGHDQIRQPAELFATLAASSPGRSPTENHARCAGTDAARRPSQGCSACSRHWPSSRAWPR